MFKKVISRSHNESNNLPSNSAIESAPTSQANAAPDQATKTLSASSKNVLAADVEIIGNIIFKNDLIIDGRVEGKISSKGNLIIGENAVIKSEIESGTVIIYGLVNGNINALDRVELKASAELHGDIKAKTIVIEAGAIFIGTSNVCPPVTPAAPLAAQPVKAPAPISTQPMAPKQP